MTAPAYEQKEQIERFGLKWNCLTIKQQQAFRRIHLEPAKAITLSFCGFHCVPEELPKDFFRVSERQLLRVRII
jgi:hypothetical protein